MSSTQNVSNPTADHDNELTHLADLVNEDRPNEKQRAKANKLEADEAMNNLKDLFEKFSDPDVEKALSQTELELNRKHPQPNLESQRIVSTTRESAVNSSDDESVDELATNRGDKETTVKTPVSDSNDSHVGQTDADDGGTALVDIPELSKLNFDTTPPRLNVEANGQVNNESADENDSVDVNDITVANDDMEVDSDADSEITFKQSNNHGSTSPSIRAVAQKCPRGRPGVETVVEPSDYNSSEEVNEKEAADTSQDESNTANGTDEPSSDEQSDDDMSEHNSNASNDDLRNHRYNSKLYANSADEDDEEQFPEVISIWNHRLSKKTGQEEYAIIFDGGKGKWASAKDLRMKYGAHGMLWKYTRLRKHYEITGVPMPKSGLKRGFQSIADEFSEIRKQCVTGPSIQQIKASRKRRMISTFFHISMKRMKY